MSPIENEAIELLKKSISFESLSKQEKPLADWLESYLKTIPDVQVSRIDNNVLAFYGSGENDFLFNSHLDVVPASPHHHYPAFSPFVENGKVFGRGSTDAKGSVTAMVSALKQLATQQFKPKHRLIFAFTACEESYGDFNGVRLLQSQHFFKKVKGAIVGEPTGMRPCIAQKGILLLELKIKGKSGHAALIQNEENALFKLPKVFETLHAIDFETTNPWIGKTKLTPTKIQGGTVNNMAPEEISLMLDIRTIPEISSDEIIQKLEELLPETEIIVKSDRFHSKSTNENSLVAQLAKQVSRKDFYGSPTCSDWAFLGEIPTIKMGPGHSEQSHTANEFIELEQFFSGIQIYTELMYLL